MFGLFLLTILVSSVESKGCKRNNKPYKVWAIQEFSSLFCFVLPRLGKLTSKTVISSPARKRRKSTDLSKVWTRRTAVSMRVRTTRYQVGSKKVWAISKISLRGWRIFQHDEAEPQLHRLPAEVRQRNVELQQTRQGGGARQSQPLLCLQAPGPGAWGVVRWVL